jgi:hypothetical protein
MEEAIIVPPKNKGGRPKGKGKSSELAELRALIEKQNDTIQALSQVKAAPALSSSENLELTAARAEIARLTRQAPVGGGEKPIPYKGMVQATMPCAIDVLRATGDVFQVDVPALWTDDPYTAVIVKGFAESGKPITEANPLAPEPADFRFRPRTTDALYAESLEVRRAADAL